jgi:hypothetical protein
MPERTTKAGSFAAYLEAELRLARKRQAQSTPPVGLLGFLADTEDKELPVSDLLLESGMGFIDFAEALKRLKDAGIVMISGTAGEEFVTLTPKGEEVAQLTRPG